MCFCACGPQRSPGGLHGPTVAERSSRRKQTLREIPPSVMAFLAQLIHLQSSPLCHPFPLVSLSLLSSAIVTGAGGIFSVRFILAQSAALFLLQGREGEELKLSQAFKNPDQASPYPEPAGLAPSLAPGCPFLKTELCDCWEG